MMKVVCLMLLLMPLSVFSQIIEKRTGDILLVTINNADPADSFSIYRKVGTNSPVLVGAVASYPDVWVYTWATTMPAGKPRDQNYAFWVELKKNNVIAGKSNVVPVKRIK